ncbi:prepilin peptidase [Gloeobacter kilaueensis]|uniref:Prepilin leader peptidase/N-methyltransferase n=1 Tax=Gloeobacter kilaueensis (strain ATCC BAA-2537 / CCAP 1431/1 / ULC 316 / JS1) TaxID=1183438 RepID=U5QIJ5_GLOK1|nr:A24 family peptidase [Gloeobacter kilaueensis]AGY57480.1 prepilin peptidase [Gloeobacter kilaueensis JS1]
MRGPFFLLAIGYWAILGAAAGSFANVVADRLPAGRSLLWPPSHCAQCGRVLRPLENVPVLGWLWLRGRCRSCGAAIPVRYAIVEALGALLFGLLAWHLGARFTPVSMVQTAFWGSFLTLLLALSLIDLDRLELPGELTSAGIVLGLGFRTFFPIWATGSWPAGPPGLVDALYGLILGIGLFDIVSYLGEKMLGKEAMGGGDAVLAAMIGVWLGWKLLLVALFVGFCLGAVGGILGLATGHLKRDEPLPFGPFLALGGVGGLLFGQSWLTGYLSLF